MWHDVTQVARNYRVNPDDLVLFAKVSTWNSDDLINDFMELLRNT